MINRVVNLPKSRHFFLLGPRQTGKSSLIRHSFDTKELLYINLLLSREYTRLKRDPGLLAQDVIGRPKAVKYVVVDEAQKIPELLDEIHQIIEAPNSPWFVLTGSSARKLKRSKANLLGGRASTVELFPLTFFELGDRFMLERALAYGTLPKIYLQDNPEERALDLRSYVDNYLKEEIEAEAVVRNVGVFLRFLPLAAESNGKELNFSKLARTCLTNYNTVKAYFQILEDTLIGRFLWPLAGSTRQQLTKRPKFYLFDTGAIRAILGRENSPLNPSTYEFGALFESWVINEVWRINSYYRKNLQTYFYRTADGAEVDLVIIDPDRRRYAIEIKSAVDVESSDLGRGFESLSAHYALTKKICVTNGLRHYVSNGVDFMPWRDMFEWLKGL
ncbi:MAG: ATP-binding protein [Pseudomonadota bacterium]|jgi:predicted AAA+ superfamily ATPase